ncbi:MAG: SRPBCC family protein [Planctomycetota bacterium]
MSTPKVVLRAMVLAMAAMVVVWFLVGLLLADTWQVVSVHRVAADETKIAALVADLGSWQQWSATDAKLGEPTTRAVEGAPATIGHRLVWSGPLGKAMLTLTAVDAGAVEYRFGMQTGTADQETARGSGRVQWRAAGGAVEVTWTDRGSWGSLAERWFGWFGALQERVRQFQVTSLQQLAARVEANSSGGR